VELPAKKIEWNLWHFSDKKENLAKPEIWE
jgi:hypothetical protein